MYPKRLIPRDLFLDKNSTYDTRVARIFTEIDEICSSIIIYDVEMENK